MQLKLRYLKNTQILQTDAMQRKKRVGGWGKYRKVLELCIHMKQMEYKTNKNMLAKGRNYKESGFCDMHCLVQ